MSDPMTNMGADDVLASIRRLVSETYDPQLRKQPSEETPERFVLSPDLRVIDGTSAPFEADAAQNEHDADDEAPLVLEPQNATHIPSLETQESDAVSETDLKLDAEQSADHTDDQTPEVSHADADETPHANFDSSADTAAEPEVAETTETAMAELDAEHTSTVVEEAVHAAQVLMQNGESADDFPVQEPEWSSAYDDTPDAQAVDHAAGLSLEERIAELENAVEAQSANDHAEYDDDGEDAPQVFPQALVNSTARVLNFRNEDFEKLADAAEVKAQVERQESAPQAAADTTTEAETVVEAETQDTAEVYQDAPVEEAHIVEAAVVVDDEPEIQEQPMRDASSVPPLKEVLDELDDDGDDDLALAGYTDDEVLDEEALRDMIATVIREELQGALGERITSNVRRLVRREVQRALTLREFD